MIEIRPAKESDLDWLVGELREFDAFYRTKYRLFGKEEIVRQKMLEIIDGHVCFIAEEKSVSPPKRTGFIAGLVRPHFYNPEIRCLSELFWWVVPKERNGMAASMLMDAFIYFGEKTVHWITFNMSKWTPVKKESFVRRGFEVSDQVFLMEV